MLFYIVGRNYENRKETMDYPVRIWIVCNWFFRLDIQSEYSQGKNCSGIIRLGLKQKKLTDGEIKSENIALPEDFDDPRSILFKTTHTIAEVWLDGEKIYEYGNEEDAPSFMKSPGSCWHIVNIPEDSAGKSLEVRIIPVYDNYYGNEVSIVYGTRAIAF